MKKHLFHPLATLILKSVYVTVDAFDVQSCSVQYIMQNTCRKCLKYTRILTYNLELYMLSAQFKFKVNVRIFSVLVFIKYRQGKEWYVLQC